MEFSYDKVLYQSSFIVRFAANNIVKAGRFGSFTGSHKFPSQSLPSSTSVLDVLDDNKSP